MHISVTPIARKFLPIFNLVISFFLDKNHLGEARNLEGGGTGFSLGLYRDRFEQS